MAPCRHHSQAVVVLVVALTRSLAAAGEAVEFAGGTGDPKDPYQIATAEQLLAIGVLEQTIPGVLGDQAWAEATKAICRKISQQGQTEGGKAEEFITRLQAELAQALEPMKPMMEAVLAHWYWDYFQQHRWRFVQRTRTAEPPGEDFTTWDLPRICAEIDKHFTLALALRPLAIGGHGSPCPTGEDVPIKRGNLRRAAMSIG